MGVGNDLNAPLGQNRPSQTRRRRKIALPAAAFIAICAVLAVSAYTAWLPAPLETGNGVLTSVERPVDPAGPIEAEASDAPAQVYHGLGPAMEEVLTQDGATVTTFRPGMAGEGPRFLVPGRDARLAHLPEPDLLEDSPFGPLPVRAADGMRPLDAYARGWSGARGARIAIVVTGLGLSQTGTQHAIRTLPEGITLAFAATGNSLNRWMQEARRGGHEILLQVPMEPFDYPNVDPGELTLTVAAPPQGNIENLHRSMARLTNYTGIMNYMGGRFMANADALEPVIREMEQRGLLFLDDGSSAQSRAEVLAHRIGTPFAAGDIMLDPVRERGAIVERLDALERTAIRNGSAVGIASAFEVSVDAIATWAEAAAGRNIEIVGVSAIVDDPERR